MVNSIVNKKILFVTGGTGGHIFPALSTYEILKKTSSNIPVENPVAMKVAIGGPNTNQQTRAKKISFNNTIKSFMLRSRPIRLVPIRFIGLL